MIEKLIFGVYPLISDFLAKSFKAHKNWQKRSLILQYRLAQNSYKPQLTQHCKEYTPAT